MSVCVCVCVWMGLRVVPLLWVTACLRLLRRLVEHGERILGTPPKSIVLAGDSAVRLAVLSACAPLVARLRASSPCFSRCLYISLSLCHFPRVCAGREETLRAG